MSVQTDIVIPAFQDLNAVASGETPSTSELADGLAELNKILGVWSNEMLVSDTPTHTTMAYVAGTSSYTMGPAGTWVATRPMKIYRATSFSGAFRRTTKVLDQQSFAAIEQSPQGETVALPGFLMHDNALTAVNVRVFPPPNAASSVELSYLTAVAKFATLGDAVTALPEGWVAALQGALSMALYPQLSRLNGDALKVLASKAQNAKASIVALNALIIGNFQASEEAA